jgi:hypothetical protein
MRNKKFAINGQLQNQLFLIVIHHFSLVKAAMNAPRICKLRNGVNKTPQFLHFFTAKGGTKAIAQLSIAEWRSNTLKGSQRMGGRRIFLKTFRASL